MKLMKRATALLLCFLMLTNGPINAFATEGVSDNDVVVTEVCEECGGSDAHTDTCSLNPINLLNNDTPVVCTVCGAENCETTHVYCDTCEKYDCGLTHTTCDKCGTVDCQSTHEAWCDTCKKDSCGVDHTTPADNNGETVGGNDVGCNECKQLEGHLDTCSQYKAPVTKCEHCGIELTEGAVHLDTCLTLCTCEPVEGVHQEGCKFYVAPVEEIADNTPQIGDKIWIKTGSRVYKNHNNVDKDYYELRGNYEVEVVSILTDEAGNAQWYEFKFTDLGWGEAFLLLGGYKYVHVDNTSVEEPDESEPGEIESQDGTVGISGSLPDGASVTVDVPDDEAMAEIMDKVFPAMGEYFSWVEFFDISIVSEGTKWQPGENVTITLDTTDIQDDQKVKVYHILDDQAAIQRAIKNDSAQSYTDDSGNTIYYTMLSSEDGDVTVNEDGTISFETDSFSIFIVQGFASEIVRSEENTIQNGSSVNMYRNEVKYFVWQWNNGEDILDATQGTWTVEQGEDNVRFEVYNSVPNGYMDPDGDGKLNDYRFAYLWLKVSALKPGTAKLQFKYKDSDGSIKTECFTIEILETNNELYVDNQIPQNGCLVPVFRDGRDTTDIEFVWSRDDNVEIYDAALEEGYAVKKGAVNVSMDRGGVDNDGNREMKTYTVCAKKDGEEVASASFTVPYGNEVINGSFEYPIAQAENTGFANGTQGLYWSTTMPADDNGTLAWDVEYLNKTYDSSANSFLNVFGIVKPKDGVTNPDFSKVDSVEPDFDLPDGNQLAEINGSNPGALYQDVLTYPGAEMYWTLAHRARNYQGNYGKDNNNYWNENAIDTMYVIMAPTAQVSHIKTQDQLKALISAAGENTDGTQITKTVDGYTITYSIRKITGNHQQWRYYDNNTTPYIVGNSEYLTRYFFAAGPTFYDDCHPTGNVTGTVGNLIDDVSFGNELPWRVEYYIDDVLQTDLTELDTVPLDRDGTAMINHAAKHMSDSRFSDYTHTKSKINGKDFATTTSLDKIYSGHNILQIYFESYGVNVTKKVEVSNYNSLSDEDKTRIGTLLKDHTFSFGLYESGASSPVATADVTVDTETLYGTATFVDSSNRKFNPDPNKTYVIKENDLVAITDLVLKTKAADTSFSNTRVYSYTATNVYELNVYGDLTIAKQGADPKDENQSFIFRVTGPDSFSMDVVIVGNESTTIKHLPEGEYTVQELTNWSWRYDAVASEPANGTVSLSSYNKQGTVTFTNTRTDHFWLSGDSYCENWWSDNSIKKRNGEDEVIE
ncbi:MAG: hypothetical protein J6B94_05565 [Lachnospiraceae bacterium]|nr:hypothetical protein [Lachnospiraceae bacterium]